MPQETSYSPLTPSRRSHNNRCRRTSSGFSLMEIMVVTLIMMIGLSVAVPNFVKARNAANMRTCIGQLQQISAAKRQYALDMRLSDGDTISMSSIAGPSKYIKGPTTGPVCPSGGTYTINTLGVLPTCSYGSGHVTTQ